MGKKPKAAVICDGNIDTALIYDTHVQIKELVESYKDVNAKVSSITSEINENWVGKGQTEFESQYNLLIKKLMILATLYWIFIMHLLKQRQNMKIWMMI